MGFTLSMASMDMFLEPVLAGEFRKHLQKIGCTFNDQIDLSHFDEDSKFFEINEEEEGDDGTVFGPMVQHLEVGTSWWGHVHRLVPEVLGEREYYAVNEVGVGPFAAPPSTTLALL